MNPPKKQTKQKKTSTKSSTSKEKAEESMAMALNILAPLVDFHKQDEDAEDSDLRIYWDVRVVRGSGDNFVSSKGTSSLPGVMSEKMQPEAASIIEQEVLEKIARPLVAKTMSKVEDEQDKLQNSDLANTPVVRLLDGIVDVEADDVDVEEAAMRAATDEALNNDDDDNEEDLPTTYAPE